MYMFRFYCYLTERKDFAFAGFAFNFARLFYFVNFTSLCRRYNNGGAETFQIKK